MGNYNAQYESYYNSMVNRRKNSRSPYNGGSTFKLDGNYIVKRLIRDLIGVAVLFIFVISCKAVVTPATREAYKYSKYIIDKNYDLPKIMSSIKQFDVKGAEVKATDWIDSMKSKITGGKTLKDNIKQNFMLPLEGTINKPFGDKNVGIDIKANINSEVVSCYDGKVKDCGEDGQLGKYILIDHGNGIETKYAYLNEILVKNDDTIKKGQLIGKSGKGQNEAEPNLHFELIYMGENENPEDYMSF